eukprot:Hpha_TRINITY_DN14089_c0_g1::TRINITY_DN14089_c0_g1_i2::g.44053::m.44053
MHLRLYPYDTRPSTLQTCATTLGAFVMCVVWGIFLEFTLLHLFRNSKQINSKGIADINTEEEEKGLLEMALAPPEWITNPLSMRSLFTDARGITESGLLPPVDFGGQLTLESVLESVKENDESMKMDRALDHEASSRRGSSAPL